MANVLLQLEQQLAALSSLVCVPASLLLTGSSILVIALIMLWTFYLGPSSSKTTASNQQTPQQNVLANGHAPGQAVEHKSGQLPAPEQLSHLIKKRRSIFPKDYTGATVSDDDLKAMLEAANWAPTHGHTEPWRFVVLGKAASKEMLELSAKMAEEVLSPEDWAKREGKVRAMRDKKLPATSHIVALGMRRAPNAAGKMMPEWEDMCACAAAVQNMQLTATSLGVGCYWSSWWSEVRDTEQFKSWLGLRPEDRCLGLLFVGCTDRADSYRAARRPIGEKVEWRK